MRSQSYRKAQRCVLPHFALCGLTMALANKRTVRPLKPVYTNEQEHEQDPDTTLVESAFIASSLIASKECPRQLRHVCNSVDDFWRKLEEEQDDTPLDIKHLVLDLHDTGVRLFVSPRSSWSSTCLIVLLHPVFKYWFVCAATDDASYSDILLTRKLSRQSTRHSQLPSYLHWQHSGVQVVFAIFHAPVGWLLAGLSIYCYFCKSSSISPLGTVHTAIPRTSILKKTEGLWKVWRVYHRGLGIWFGISKCVLCVSQHVHTNRVLP